MPAQKIHIEEFLELANHHPVLDVRSPAEYDHAHIPGAYSLALFTDEERRLVGTAYKQQSREAAIKVGLDFFGPKMRRMVEEVEALIDDRYQITEKKITAIVLVHCWRGGMRSAGVAWLLDLYGFKVYSLIGGYKQYRNYVLQIFKGSYHFKILGGYTGSGKTIILQALEKMGDKVIDLETIACHKGSAFGAIGQAPQPKQEMFENLLSAELIKKSGRSAKTGSPDHIWLEDESQRIGLINIPQAIWEEMRRSPVFFIDVPFEERLNYVVETYGKLSQEKIAAAITRIRKRLGGLETKTALQFLSDGDTRECFRILLKYYDRHYLKALNSRKNGDMFIKTIVCPTVEPAQNAQRILTYQRTVIATNYLDNE